MRATAPLPFSASRYFSLAGILFASAALLCILTSVNPGAALLLGFLCSFALTLPHPQSVHRIGKLLIAWAIVGYGLTVHVRTVFTMTADHFAVTLFCIATCLLLGRALASFIGLSGILSALISSGTSICGASAIAAVGGTLKAPAAEMSMSLGVVFIFNAIALFLFPYLGHLLALTPHQFGIWAGLGIHDTSSVIGAALLFDPESVEVATTVKLARAIWIAPLCLYFAHTFRSPEVRSFWSLTPWFIWGYLASASLSSVVTLSPAIHHYISAVARQMFILGVFFIGSTTDLRVLHSLGLRPFALGLLLWILSAGIGLGYCLLF